MSKELRIIILAAGKGTRMNSDLPKVLHKLNGKALLDFVLDESELLNPKETILVVGFKKEQVISHTQHRTNLKYATQMEQLGTGHAVLQTGDLLKNKEGHILILYGDVPNIKESTLRPIIDDHLINNRDLTLITAEIDDHTGHGPVAWPSFRQPIAKQIKIQKNKAVEYFKTNHITHKKVREFLNKKIE